MRLLPVAVASLLLLGLGLRAVGSPLTAPAPDVARLFVVGLLEPEYTPDIAELVELGVGGVILFQRNYRSLPQLLQLTRTLKERAGRPFLIGVNHEGGRIQHFGPPFTPLPAMQVMGLLNSSDAALKFGRLGGAELRAANVDVNFAPVVDVNTNPANPVIGDRALGSEAALVARLGAAITSGMQGAGVAACLKHFPGHGDTAVDSHLALPFVNLSLPELEATHFRPFRDIIAHPGPAAVMTSHIVFEQVDPLRPATMSPPILQGVLREKFGFRGVIFSDSMEMSAVAKDGPSFDAAVVDAVNAGVDMVLVPHTPLLQRRALAALSRAVRQGRVPATRIQEAHRRIDALFQQYVRPPAPASAAEVIGCQRHQTLRAAWRPPEELQRLAAADWKGNEL